MKRLVFCVLSLGITILVPMATKADEIQTDYVQIQTTENHMMDGEDASELDLEDITESSNNLADNYEKLEESSNSGNVIKQIESDSGPIVGNTDNYMSAEFVIEDGVLTKYTGNREYVTIPNGVKRVGYGAFENMNFIKTVVIPDSVITIESYAFYKCSGLTDIELPESLDQILQCAFSGCENLVNVRIPYKVTVISDNVFVGCVNLKTVTLPETIHTIEANAFYGCSSLESINIPRGVTTIPRYCFRECKNLKKVNMPGVQDIDIYAFSFCEALEEVSVSEKVWTISENAFEGCIKLTGIPSTIGSVRSRAFKDCKSIKKIVLNDFAYEIATEAFVGCTSLEYIKIPPNILNIKADAFYKCDKLKIYGKKNTYAETYAKSKGIPFVRLIESREDKIEAFVERLYLNTLGRDPDQQGMNFYKNNLLSKKSNGAEVAYGFLFSPEFANRNLSDDKYIEILYAVMMDRKADSAGQNYYENLLSNGVSRSLIFKGFVESPEYTKICIDSEIERGTIILSEPRDQNPNLTMFIFRLYEKALQRTAENDGLNYYCSEIMSKRVTPIEAAQNFIFSPEFKGKKLDNIEYIKVLYRTFMGREFDKAGLEYHLQRIENGVGREEILNGFAYSPEFEAIMNGFGI